MHAGTILRDAIVVLAAVSLAYYAFALFAASRFFKAFAPNPATANPASAGFAPPISILKPVHGLDREAYENFASFCRQDYPEYEILFCVGSADDPAVPVIEQLVRDLRASGSPQRSFRLLIGSEPVGVSDKVNKLCRMVREARHEILLISDSDVRVEPGFLRTVAAHFADASIGGVTCLYRGVTDGSLAADVEALGNSADFAPSVIVASLLGDLNFMLGAVMVTTKTRLAEIGGFEALADYFCDDYELGNRIATRGHRIVLSHAPVAIVYPHQTWKDAFRHQLRWNLSIRYSRPWGHAGLIFTQGLFWTVAAIFALHSWLGMLFAAAYLLLRGEMALYLAGAMRDPLVRRRQWLIPVRDAFGFVVWAVSFFPQRIHWRGQQFHVREKRLVASQPR
jgi:ceramide glucosyltransferase